MMTAALRFTFGLFVVSMLTSADPVHAQGGPGGFASVDEEIADAMAIIERSRARKERVDAEIEGLAERRAAAQSRLRTRTRALYRISQAGMLPLAGGFPALLAHLSRVDRLERMVSRDARGLTSLATRGRALREQTGQLAVDIASAETRLEGLEGQRARLDELSARTDFWDRSFGASSPPRAGGQSGWGSLSLTGGALRPAFPSQRGRLGMPVAGRVDVRPGDRGDGSGVEVFASHGATVRAVDEGRVAYVDRHPGYGPMVIVDHGDSYFTVYAGIDQTSVRVGDHVPRGARLGSVGSAAIFFQVRRGTRALDASAWLGL